MTDGTETSKMDLRCFGLRRSYLMNLEGFVILSDTDAAIH